MLDRFEEEELVLDLDVAEPRRPRSILREIDHDGNLQLDLPPWQDQILDGAGGLDLLRAPVLLVARPEFELALDDGAPRDNRIEELEVWLLLREGRGRTECAREGQQGEPRNTERAHTERAHMGPAHRRPTRIERPPTEPAHIGPAEI